MIAEKPFLRINLKLCAKNTMRIYLPNAEQRNKQTANLNFNPIFGGIRKYIKP
jgi:hypothetical protein